MMSIPNFQKEKGKRQLSVLTCYDASFARILNDTDIDAILVGDSASMVMHGFSSTVMATMEMMLAHTAAVVRGASDKLVIADMPFLSYRMSLQETLRNVQLLMQAGAHAIKLEGAEGNLETVRFLIESGVPVMGHLGLTPQHVHKLGGNKVQAKDEASRNLFRKQAHDLQEAGCFSIVFECIPSSLAGEVSKSLNIPTIGIGAGAEVDGQVLVLQDMLGMQKDFKPKFLKTYLDGYMLIQGAVNQYVKEVCSKEFPTERFTYGDR
jgi:3-methyl-2-oxobutanoate hydroxymethyltransferase